MTFRASTGEAITALEEAARRTGMQHLAADPTTGVLVFTAGRMLLAFGEKVTARIRDVGPGILMDVDNELAVRYFAIDCHLLDAVRRP